MNMPELPILNNPELILKLSIEKIAEAQLKAILTHTIQERTRNGGGLVSRYAYTVSIVDRFRNNGTSGINGKELNIISNKLLTAFFLLERELLIVEDPSQSSRSFFILTERGEEVAKNSTIQKITDYAVLEKLNLEPETRLKIESDFIVGDHDSVVMKATKVLETTIRCEMGSTPSEKIDVIEVINRNLKEKELTINKDSQEWSNMFNFYNLIRSFVTLYKNNTHHKNVEMDNFECLKIVGFIDLMIKNIKSEEIIKYK